jgi:glycine cleavage system protein P-like pyridoxal-binding family
MHSDFKAGEFPLNLFHTSDEESAGSRQMLEARSVFTGSLQGSSAVTVARAAGFHGDWAGTISSPQARSAQIAAT